MTVHLHMPRPEGQEGMRRARRPPGCSSLSSPAPEDSGSEEIPHASWNGYPPSVDTGFSALAWLGQVPGPSLFVQQGHFSTGPYAICLAFSPPRQ